MDRAEPAVDADLESELQSFHAASFGWALACCRHDRDEAAEVLQIAYLKALDGRARRNGHASTRTWFFGVLKRTAQERRRSRLVRELALDRWLRRHPGRDVEPTPESQSSAAEQQARLLGLLDRLPSRQRDMLHLVFYQDLTVEDAASVLHVSVGTARTHYDRGKRRLRELLHVENGNGTPRR
jgi:RNA polymerase sigma-70 factor (ECF subfamily)